MKKLYVLEKFSQGIHCFGWQSFKKFFNRLHSKINFRKFKIAQNQEGSNEKILRLSSKFLFWRQYNFIVIKPCSNRSNNTAIPSKRKIQSSDTSPNVFIF